MNPFLQRFLADRSGNILIMTGIGFLFLFGIGGAGYDLGRQQLVKQRLQQASDAAAVAAASMEGGTTVAERQQMARNVYALNFPNGYLGVTRPAADVQVGVNTVQVTTTTASIPTSFVNNFGRATLPASAATTTRIFRGPPPPIDLIFVMDNSGSMGFEAGPSPAFLSTNVATTAPYCRSWLINNYGYSNVCANYSCGPSAYNRGRSIACLGSAAAVPPNYASGGITGTTRLNALRYAADYAAASLLAAPNANNNRIANVTWSDLVVNTQAYSSNLASVQNFIRGMFVTSTTNSTVGLAAAQAISNAGRRTGAQRAIVLLTDGVNYPDPVAYNATSLPICSQLKQDGVLVYTIAFGEDVRTNATVAQFLSDCATGGGSGNGTPNLNTTFFIAPDGNTLQEAFQSILGSLQRVQIIQ